MPTLHVRNVPAKLYKRISRFARTQNRSLSAEVITLLDRALSGEERRLQTAAILEEIRRTRFVPPPGVPDAVDLIREDRQR